MVSPLFAAMVWIKCRFVGSERPAGRLNWPRQQRAKSYNVQKNSSLRCLADIIKREECLTNPDWGISVRFPGFPASDWENLFVKAAAALQAAPNGELRWVIDQCPRARERLEQRAQEEVARRLEASRAAAAERRHLAQALAASAAAPPSRWEQGRYTEEPEPEPEPVEPVWLQAAASSSACAAVA